jgi:hypothetical protein
VQRAVRIAFGRVRGRRQEIELPSEGGHRGHDIERLRTGDQQHQQSADHQNLISVSGDGDRRQTAKPNAELDYAPDLKQEAVHLRRLIPEHLPDDICSELVNVPGNLPRWSIEKPVHLREVLTCDDECEQDTAE